MNALALSVTVLLMVTSALAADPPKPATTTPATTPKPAIQSDAAKPLTQPSVVGPPGAKAVPPAGVPAVTAPTATGTPPVSGPKVSPGAPGGGPAAPTIPAAGTPAIDPKLGGTIRDANQRDAIRDLKQLEQLNRDPLQRGAPAGTGETGPPRTLGTGRLTTPPARQGPQGYGPDCLSNPQDCVPGAGGARDGGIVGGRRDTSGSGNATDRMGGPPVLGRGIPDPRGPVSSGSFTSVSVTRNHDGSYAATGTYTHDRGRAEFHATGVRDSEGNWHYESRVVGFDEKGKLIYSGVMTSMVDRNGNTTQSAQSLEGEIPEEVARAGDDLVEAARNPEGDGSGRTRSAGGSDSQPREDPNAGSGRNDGCNWAPIHGCLSPREDIRTTVRQRTTQPGINPDGEGAEGGGGSSRGGSTGPEAVTNTGDGSFGVQRSGNSGGGTPVWQTLPDPARGGPGGPAPGSPVRRAGSDAGIDATTGAMPAPPPPPR